MVLSESWDCWRGSGCSNREWVRVPPPHPGVQRLAGWLAQVVLVHRSEELPAGGPRNFLRMPSEAGPRQLS